MFNRKFAAAASAALVFAGSQAYADSANFGASANILEALQLVKNTDLSFATIVPDSASSGTVTVSPAGARTCPAPLTCSGVVSAADFSISGASGATYTLGLPSSADISDGTNTMLVDNFTSSLGGPTGTLTGGAGAFQLGATLNVGAAQATGTYTGTFTVTVDYN